MVQHSSRCMGLVERWNMDSKQHKSNRKPNGTLLIPLLTGLITAQIIATCFVYLSNQKIHEAVTAATEAGYFPIPAGPVVATLETVGAAFWGGLFFTLSIGAGLALMTWAAIRLCAFFQRKEFTLRVISCAVWLGLLVAVNTKGLVLFPSLFVLAVPLATAWVAIKLAPVAQERLGWLRTLPVITLFLLTALWTTQLNQGLFTTIRDHLLLSNPVGRTVNDFYYRYTLYAAETFKSFNQKTLRTYRLEKITNQRLARRLASQLIKHDMLHLPALSQPDLTLSLTDEHLMLKSAGGFSLKTTPNQFLTDPNPWLQKLSKSCDRYAPLRRMTLIGLLLGFPILLFVAVYSFLSTGISFFLKPRGTTYATSALCLVIGISLFMPMLNAHPVTITNDNIGVALAAEQWTHRLAALRYIEKQKIEIGRYPQYRKLFNSTHVAERYWLARALAQSRMPSTYNGLMILLQDPHPNVICQTYFALGRRGNAAAINPIKKQMTASDHWYSQWYGYRALRKLGWRQSRSN